MSPTSLIVPALGRREMTPPTVEASGDALPTDYADYLNDESRLGPGDAAELCVAGDEAAAVSFLRRMSRSGTPVTVSAGRTGIVGGAVPMGGAVLSIAGLDEITALAVEKDGFVVTCGAGVAIEELARRAAADGFVDLFPDGPSAEAAAAHMDTIGSHLYPPDPTEMTALIGGTVATDASGGRCLGYGPTRRYVRGLRALLATGEGIALARGEVMAAGRTLHIPTIEGREIEVPLPTYEMPRAKSSAGYYARDGQDAVDLIVGSEGTLSVITSVDLQIVPRRGGAIRGVVFFAEAGGAIAFVETTRHDDLIAFCAVESSDARALDLLRDRRAAEPGCGIPAFPDDAVFSIFFEAEWAEARFERAAAALEEAVSAHGGDAETMWVGTEPHEIERITALRHLLPETVNMRVSENKRRCPALHKVSTDMAVDDEHLREVLALYEEAFTDLATPFVTFGHIGENHVHVNLLPETEEALTAAKERVREVARRVVAMGGTVSGEHGIGRMRRDLLEIMYGEEGLREMAGTKRALDPAGILGRGVLFDERYL